MSAGLHSLSSAKELREQAVRKGISDLMDQCTEKQLAGLHRIHDSAPWKGIANCPENQLDTTYELLRRTVAANWSLA